MINYYGPKIYKFFTLFMMFCFMSSCSYFGYEDPPVYKFKEAPEAIAKAKSRDYPNLADVPNPPETIYSAKEREEQKRYLAQDAKFAYFPKPTQSSRKPYVASKQSVKIATLYFDKESIGLGDSEREILKKVIQYFYSNPGKLVVIGHQNPYDIEAESYSKQRANFISTFLTSKKVPQEDIMVVDQAFYEPEQKNEAFNRRVDIYFNAEN